jgi:hypothetical protein
VVGRFAQCYNRKRWRRGPPKEVDFTRRSSGALGQRALPESLAAQGRDGWPSRPHMCLLPWMTCPSVPLGPNAFWEDRFHGWT